MKQSFMDLCSEFAQKVRYNLALACFIPNEDVMKEMGKDGWKKVPYIPTQAEIVSAATAGGHGTLILPLYTVKDSQGRDVFRDPNPAVHKDYRAAMRKASASLHLKPAP